MEQIFLHLFSFDMAQQFLKPPSTLSLTYREQQIRAMKLLIIGCCILKRIQQKRPKLFQLIDQWMKLHSQKTLGDLFSIKKYYFY